MGTRISQQSNCNIEYLYTFWRYSTRLGTIVILIMILSGCAFTNVNLVMPTEGLENPIPGGNGREIVVVVPFADDRKIHRCGMQKNGYNMDTADAICTTDPAVWIANLLVDELTASGFSVIGAESPHRGSALRIEGSLLKVFVEPLIGMWTGSHEADLYVKLIATSNNGLRAERNFFVKGRQGGAMVSVTPLFELALRRATSKLLSEMVEAIISFMNRYPELGCRTTNTKKLVAKVLETSR